ncbi:MAG: hypothetical protein MI861_20525 [Pirellulales bacterium]|nr:hypothetical protein [Pirellulales bacterium]
MLRTSEVDFRLIREKLQEIAAWEDRGGRADASDEHFMVKDGGNFMPLSAWSAHSKSGVYEVEILLGFGRF